MDSYYVTSEMTCSGIRMKYGLMIGRLDGLKADMSQSGLVKTGKYIAK